MAFCASCGEKNADDAKFCNGCGKAVAPAQQALPAKEKVGNIRTCPSCGETLESFQGRCKSCGHELTNVKAANSVQSFFERIVGIKMEEEKESAAQTAARAKGRKALITAGIVVLIITAGVSVYFLHEWGTVPAPFLVGSIAFSVLLFAIAAFGLSFKAVSFSRSENEAKSLIENFPIPNAREDLLEFLILSSSKIEPAYGLNYGARKQRAWNQIWATKIRQVQDKIELTFAADRELLGTAKKIQAKTEQIATQARKRAIVLAAVVAALIVVPIVLITVAVSPDSLPGPRILEANEITLAGVHASLFRATGGQIEAVEVGGRPHIVLTLDLESIGSFPELRESRIREDAARRGWENDVITWRIMGTWSGAFTLTEMVVGSATPTAEHLRDNMEPGDTERVRITFRPIGSHRANPTRAQVNEERDRVINAMTASEFSIGVNQLTYLIVNESIERGSGTNREFSINF